MTMQSLLEEARHLLETSNWPQMSSRPGVGTIVMKLFEGHVLFSVISGYTEDKISGTGYSTRSDLPQWPWNMTLDNYDIIEADLFPWLLPPPDLHDRIWAEHCAEQLTNG